MKELDKRQKALLGGLLAAVVLITALLLLPLFAPEKSGDKASVVATIPEADIAEGDDSKTASYRSGNISDYWDELETEDDRSLTPVLPDEAEKGGFRERESRRPATMVVDDIFGDYKDASPEAPKQAPARRPNGTSSAGSGNHTQNSEPQASDDETKPEPPRPQVKRSGAVSSLDEDVADDLGNGFSTLDGTDRWVGGEAGKPYRCMFTRDEKVKSGQRITVRLLEDLVIGSTHVPRNTHLQGLVTISDRMEVSINSLDVGGKILSFHFEAFDSDGGKGIYCSDLSKTKKEITEQGLATASSTLNSRLGRVARDAAAVGASIVSNKAGEATVTVPAGYTFYIIEEIR
ncbi:MAG: conjugative transposon protein TraM [Firmicutes bacterium]|nr:conjugative transposon protein TraM [Bacillota bacterium]